MVDPYSIIGARNLKASQAAGDIIKYTFTLPHFMFFSHVPRSLHLLISQQLLVDIFLLCKEYVNSMLCSTELIQSNVKIRQ